MKTLLMILLVIYGITFSTTIPKISKENENKEINPISIKTEEPIGKILISKINLEQDLYQKGSSENTIEKHVSILKESTSPEEEESIMILAAHSGTGEIAYFEKLDYLQIRDIIELQYKHKTYYYEVNEIWEEEKNGFIHINKENKKQLILTTCSPNKDGYQLVISCIEKES